MALIIDGGRIKRGDLENFLIGKGFGYNVRASYLECFDRDNAGANRDKLRKWVRDMDDGCDHGKALKSDCHNLAIKISAEI